MRQSQKDALRIIREARAHAMRTSDSRLHMACIRSIDAMISDGCMMPSELRTYARDGRETYGNPDTVTLPFRLIQV